MANDNSGMRTLLPLQLLVAPDRNDPDPLVLYHGKGCPDGFAAALAAWTFYEGRVQCLGLDHGQVQTVADLPPLQGRTVYVLDFAFAPELLRAIEEGRHHPQPHPPEYEPRPDYTFDKAVLARFDALRKWRSEVARQRDVAPDIVMPNSTLLTIAQRNPTSQAELAAIPEIGEWKVQAYGSHILATLNAKAARSGSH